MEKYDKGSRLGALNFGGFYCTCPECGKKFFCPDASTWAYKLRMGEKSVRRYCSWSCLQKARKEKELKLKRPKYKYDTGRR